MAVEPFFIIVNSSGSDTAASGCGPATAVSGTGASITSASTTVDLSADSPDLSAVVADDLIWVDASSGRQWGRIASVDNVTKTITLTSNNLYSVTEFGRNWGIGGKRATLSNLDNFMLFRNTAAYVGDMSYYGISIESDQTITAKFPSTDVGHNVVNVIKGSGVVRPKITCSQPAGTPAFRTGWSNGAAWYFHNLEFVNTNNAATDEFLSVYGSAGRFTATECKFGSPGDQNALIEDGHLVMTFINCEVHCSNLCVWEVTSAGPHFLKGSSFFGNGLTFVTQRSQWYIDSCVFNNFGDLLNGYSQSGLYFLTNNVFDNITNVFRDTISSLNVQFLANHNNCYSNIGTVFAMPTPTYQTNLQRHLQFGGSVRRYNNNYFNVTTVGDTLNSTETQLDPMYADAASNDYTITNPSLLNGGGYPISLGGYSVTSSVGPSVGTGGGGSVLHPLYATGRR